MSRKVVSTNLRFNMAEPDEKKAWVYLQGLDREKYKSYTKAVVLALNEYFDRQARIPIWRRGRRRMRSSNR